METLRHSRRPPRRVGRVVALMLVGVLATGGAAVGALWWRFEHNITALDTAPLLGDDRPAPAAVPDPTDPHAGRAVNVLVLGSDDRSGDNAAIGGEAGGMRSDTTLVVHVSADRTRVVAVSIPRDSLVDIPACTMTDGSTTAPRKNRPFNDAFALGWDHGHDITSASACAMRTVEQVTGVRLDGVLVADFSGFQDMVDAIGGVPYCFETDLDDSDSGLHVTAGPRVLDGRTALSYARARHDIGDGSDLSRIGRQQQLLGAVVREVMHRDVLTSAPALLSFVDAATRSLSASNGFDSLTGLAGLGRSLQDVGLDRVVFVMVPVADSPTHKGKVVWTAEATTLWERIAADLPVGDADAEQPAPPTTPPPSTAPPTTAPPTATAPTAPTPPPTPWAPRHGVRTSSQAATGGACAATG